MNFVKSSGLSSIPSENVNWTTNPIYKSPEVAGISWYDQATHWDPSSEGIFSIAQNSTDNPIPYWASRDSDLQGIRGEWSRSERQVTQNSASATSQVAPTSVASTQSNIPVASLAPTESQLPSKVANAKDFGKVAGVVSGVGSAAASAASLAGPVGIAAAINAAAGAGTASAIDASNKSIISSDFVANSKVQGSQSTHQAQLVKELDTAHANITASGAQIGGLAGPLGAWFGSLIANAVQDSSPRDLYNDLKTGYSFDGRFNPQDTGSVNSATTANLSGQSNIQSNL